MGAKASAFFTSVINVGPNTTVETSTTVSAKTNLYDYVMDKQYSEQTSTTSPFKLEVEKVTEVNVTTGAKTKIEGVDVSIESTTSIDTNNGEINNEVKSIIGIENNGLFISNTTSGQSNESTTRACIQLEAETPTVGGTSFKVGASFSIGQDEKK